MERLWEEPVFLCHRFDVAVGIKAPFTFNGKARLSRLGTACVGRVLYTGVSMRRGGLRNGHLVSCHSHTCLFASRDRMVSSRGTNVSL